jgi:D-psicose/D-tagatose/L-ribulose 3-epimerase
MSSVTITPMQFGICSNVENASIAAQQGWDYVEPSVQDLLNGQVEDGQWNGAARIAGCALPARCANLLVPPGLKITGSSADPQKLAGYMRRVCRRAQACGIDTLVFGSAGARNVPDGFDRERACTQIIAFARASAAIAEQHAVVIVCEPLNRGESNIINSVAEAMAIVTAVNHPNFACLVDSYHLWAENEPLENVERALQAGAVRHVHVADRIGRVAPGESGAAAEQDYRELFRVLKSGGARGGQGYDRTISVEALGFADIAGVGPRVLAFLRRQWEQA